MHALGLEVRDSHRLRLYRDFGSVDDFAAEFVEIGRLKTLIQMRLLKG